MASESRFLLPQAPTTSGHLQWYSRCCQNVCLPSKAAILIILWTAIIGTMYYFILSVAVIAIYTNPLTTTSIPEYASLLYAILALAMVFYPLSGFLADVCCGRLKIVILSLCLLSICGLLVCFVEIIALAINLESENYYSIFQNFHEEIVYRFLFTFMLITIVLFIVGLAGFQANYVQLGLDQLFEAPSKYLALFIHCATWAFHIGSLPLQVSVAFFYCSYFLNLSLAVAFVFATPCIATSVLITLLVVARWKRQWFYSEPGQENPYRTVFKVINFARKHKYPLQRSAFTYSDHNIPSRIDFAKERYGGPFSVEQVENVKTFLRILLMLLTLGPVFSLEVPASYFVFPLFGLHVLHYHRHFGKDFCGGSDLLWETIFVGTGSFKTMLSMLCFFPIYIWITISLLHNKLKTLFTRILTGIVLCLLGIISLLVIDSMGHSLVSSGKHESYNNSQCMFQVYRTNTTISYPALNMHWSVLIPLNLLLGIGPLIIVTTSLEFISAQSPQSMKGLLIGVFFAIRGLFHFLNSIVIFPFSLNQPRVEFENTAVSCGSVYLLFTCVGGLIGLILFSVAAKKYRYRERDEGLFCQLDVEEIHERYITQNCVHLDNSALDDSTD